MATVYVCIIIIVNCLTSTSILQSIDFWSYIFYRFLFIPHRMLKKEDNSYNWRKDLNETNHEWNLEKLKLWINKIYRVDIVFANTDIIVIYIMTLYRI